MENKNQWFRGICKACLSDVILTPSPIKDYRWRCSNATCRYHRDPSRGNYYRQDTADDEHPGWVWMEHEHRSPEIHGVSFECENCLHLNFVFGADTVEEDIETWQKLSGAIREKWMDHSKEMRPLIMEAPGKTQEEKIAHIVCLLEQLSHIQPEIQMAIDLLRGKK